MKLMIERVKVTPVFEHESRRELAVVEPPEWFGGAVNASATVTRKDRVDNVASGDCFEVVFSGLVD